MFICIGDLIIKLKSTKMIQFFCITLIYIELFGIFYFDHIWITIIFIASLIVAVVLFRVSFLEFSAKIPLILITPLINLHVFIVMFYLLDFGIYIVIETFLCSTLTIIIATIIFFLIKFPYILESDKKLKISKFKEDLVKLSGFLISIWAYVPIMAGILTPMFIFFPIVYSSWQILDFIISESTYYNSLNSWFVIYPWEVSLIFSLILIEICIFLIGLELFLSGFITLLRSRKDGQKIAQMGPYKYIRHPQNLGIILMVLPFTLYIPGFGDIGIRIIDILSWILFSFIILIISDYEENTMLKKYSEEYNHYRNRTGFFFPKIWKLKLKLIQNRTLKYVIRYFILVLCFIIIVLWTNFIAEILYFNGIVEIFR